MDSLGKDKELILSKMESEEREFLVEVITEIEKSGLKPELPVLYPGSASDIEHAVLLGHNLVFIDTHLPETNINEIRSKLKRMGNIIEDRRIGVLGEGGKHFFRFALKEGINEYRLTYYSEDAAKLRNLGLDELRGGYSVYFVKVPLPKEKKSRLFNISGIPRRGIERYC